MSPGNCPQGNSPDDVITNEISESIKDDQDDDAWKDACKIIEDRFGESA